MGVFNINPHKTPMLPNLRSSLPVLALVSAFSLQPSSLLAQGSLTPPGAPAPTMKTLQQIEPRTAITNTGAVTISQPGSYYLTANLAVSSGDAITIATNGVTLDRGIVVFCDPNLKDGGQG